MSVIFFNKTITFLIKRFYYTFTWSNITRANGVVVDRCAVSEKKIEMLGPCRHAEVGINVGRRKDNFQLITLYSSLDIFLMSKDKIRNRVWLCTGLAHRARRWSVTNGWDVLERVATESSSNAKIGIPENWWLLKNFNKRRTILLYEKLLFGRYACSRSVLRPSLSL